MTEELFREDVYLRRCEARVTAATADGIGLDRTVFYPMGGGQPGDTGMFRLPNGTQIVITDTRKGEAGDILHIPAPGTALPPIGTAVVAEIDWERRYRHMRMHTCLHLLCAVIGAGVTGGAISADRGRLDFDLPEPLDKQQVTTELNRLIQENHATRVQWITDAELEVQPELVKTLSVQPPRGQGRVRLLGIPGVDLQPCGGTHVASTAEIGPVVVTKIEKKSRHNRRVNITFADS